MGARKKTGEGGPRLPPEPLASDEKMGFGHLAAALAHDVRNPLNSIAIHADLMESRAKRSGGPDADAILRSVAVIVREVDRIDGLLSCYLEHVGPADLVRRLVPVDELVGAALDRAGARAAARKVRIERSGARPAGERWPVDADALGGALDALLASAVASAPSGGAVTVGVRAHDGQGSIEVRDGGAAIPADELARLFHLGGKGGVGLTVAKQIVKMHGGSIHADPDGEGQGTRFRIDLPLDLDPDE
jgi:signal transduction histidine kinase